MIADNVGSFIRCRLQLETTEIGTLTNSEDQDKMLHNVVSHQDLHCFLRQNQSPESEIQNLFRNYNLCPLNKNNVLYLDFINYCDCVAFKEKILV